MLGTIVRSSGVAKSRKCCKCSDYRPIIRVSPTRKNTGGVLLPFRTGSPCGSRSFSVFPVFRPGPKHLRYNAMALYELLRATKPTECTSNATEFRATAPAHWWRYFHLSAKRYGRLDPETNVITAHRDRTRFAMSFTTNGAYCSVSMERFVPKNNDSAEPESKRSKRKQTKTADDNDSVDLSKFSGFLGLDPGVVNYVGACYLDNENTDQKRNFTLKTAKFKQSECKERVIKRRREKLID